MSSKALQRDGLWCQMARPTAAGMKKDTSVNVRLTAELKGKLQRLADADGRKLSNYIERVLGAHVQAMEKPQEPATKKR
jgi:predicted DNA binding CopG/RHH family protein